MEKSRIKPGIKTGIVVFCFFLTIALIMVFSTIRSTSFDHMAGAKLLRQIHANTLAYRLAEIEYVLSLGKESKDEYLHRMTSALQLLERNQSELEPLLATGEGQSAYAAFKTAWNAYMKECKANLALSKRNLHQQAIASLTEHSRVLYEQASQTLKMLVNANAKHHKSWFNFMKVFFEANRLTLTFLYICGMAAFLILIFNLYDKANRREDIDET